MSTAKSKNFMNYLHVIIMFALMIIPGLLPPVGGITEMGMGVLGVLMGLLYGWIFVDLLWPSLVGFVALYFTGAFTLPTALANAFGNYNVLMVLFAYPFADALRQLGVTDAIAYWIMKHKFFAKSPWYLIIAICVTAALLGFANGGLAGVFLMWAIAEQIAGINGLKNDSTAMTFIYFMILVSAILSICAVPFYATTQMFYSYFYTATNLPLPAVPYFILGVIYVAVFIAAMLLVYKFIFKDDVSQFRINEELCDEYAQYRSNKKQKAGLIGLVLYFVALMGSSIFPKLPGMSTIASLNLIGITIIFMVVFAILKDEEGKSYVNVDECFKEGVMWSTLVLMAVTMPLAAAIQSSDTGIIAAVTNLVMPIVSDMSPVVLIVVFVLIMAVLTQLLHNLVVCAVLMPFLANIMVTLGGNPYVLFITGYFALINAFATPAASPNSAIIFGRSDLSQKKVYKAGITATVVSCILIVVLIIPLGFVLL